MVMGVAAMFGIFSGTYFWFPKMTGHMMNETIGKIAFLPDLRWHLLHLYAVPLSWLGRKRAPLCRFTDDFLMPLIPVHQFITFAAFTRARCNCSSSIT